MSDHEPCCAACGGAGADMSGPCSDCYGTGCAHPPMTAIDRVAEVLTETWEDRIKQGISDAPRGHCHAFADALADAGLLASPDQPSVEIERRLGQPDTCVVTHRGVVIFDGVDRSALLRTESAAAHDAAVIEKFLREEHTPVVRIENPEFITPLLAKAWDEGFKQGGPMHDENLDDPDAHTRNPYRKGETDDRR